MTRQLPAHARQGLIRGRPLPGERILPLAAGGAFALPFVAGTAQVLGFVRIPAFHWVVWPTTLLLIALIAGFAAHRRRRGLAQVRDAHYRLCLHCRHPLLPDAGDWLCPECGHKWAYSTLEASWSWTYRGD